MRERLIALLKALEKAVPPPPGQHHAITYAQYGCDELGWEDRLALSIRNMDGKGARVVFLDDGDLERPTSELVSAIIVAFIGCPEIEGLV